MKKQLLVCLLSLVAVTNVFSQEDKSKRVSPPAKVSETTDKGITVSIDYSQPSLKGRQLGVDVAPFGQVWRTGANEATVFEISKDAKIEGKPLKAGKYSFYSIPGEEGATLIFNKAWKQWGTVYNEAEDALRINVTPSESPEFTEKMTFTINKSGVVTFRWGNGQAEFKVD
ncbi:MAG: DUF2911 domain-containing protein [Chitinophagaceae bacterium]|nr:DUF2911 domain-containing protein [Chitinophagaceae bacterium]